MLTVFSLQRTDRASEDDELYVYNSNGSFGPVCAVGLAPLVQMIVGNDAQHRNLGTPGILCPVVKVPQLV